MRNVSEFLYTIKSHILYSVICSFENRAVYEIMWKICYSRTGYR